MLEGLCVFVFVLAVLSKAMFWVLLIVGVLLVRLLEDLLVALSLCLIYFKVGGC